MLFPCRSESRSSSECESNCESQGSFCGSDLGPPPTNTSDAGNVTTYHIRFKQDGKEWCESEEMTVDGSTTSVVLTRESGLVPLTTYDFAVRAQSGEDVGEWETVSAYFGIYANLH